MFKLHINQTNMYEGLHLGMSRTHTQGLNYTKITHSVTCSHYGKHKRIEPATTSSRFIVSIEKQISSKFDFLGDNDEKCSKYDDADIGADDSIIRWHYEFLLGLFSESQGEKSQEVIRLLNLASRDCVPQQRNTLVQLQSQTGVEVCTFRLVVKNAASLLDKDDLVKLEAEASLDDLIRSFSFLGNMMTDCNFQIETDREKLRDGLMDTISSLDRFEQGIKNCLGV
ncbi:hypothetical protein ZIOFF_050859 [Zingiber officinale]|uniref:Uncharacterized protein n=1 Tax=Zingiber officinale TaxID=94328 RepID=A0A8J5FL24_ZINOF|nr:hypothetical protein ZIOFF_050859 [Zingiber officinale]